MTREEAIHILYGIRANYLNHDDWQIRDRYKALCIAINALDREHYYKDLAESYEKTINKLTKAIAEQEPCEDCISRAKAIEALGEEPLVWCDGEDEIAERDQWRRDVTAIEALPSVKQEPKTGHWKLVQRGKVIDACCSNCESVRIKEWAYNYTIDELNKEDINECFGSAEMRFCPYCGARMDEASE